MLFEELDSQPSPIGEISLRRRADPRLNGTILYEVKLGDDYLMSSLFTEAELQLSYLGLAALARSGHVRDLDVVVGGLGLGYTAVAALESAAVGSLQVIDVMAAVIDWHQRGLVPMGPRLTGDPRCRLVQGDFFALASDPTRGFHSDQPARQVHAVLLDIDHSPSHWLNPDNSRFYTQTALQTLSDKLIPGGLFGLWSNDLPDPTFTALLESVFETVEAHVVRFANPYTLGESTNSVYLATKAA